MYVERKVANCSRHILHNFSGSKRYLLDRFVIRVSTISRLSTTGISDSLVERKVIDQRAVLD